MQYELGELYIDNIVGIICVTELNTEDLFGPLPLEGVFGERPLGYYTRLQGDTSYVLLDKFRRKATDADIKEYLLWNMLHFKLSNNSGVSISTDGYIGIYDTIDGVSLSKQEAKNLLEILIRETSL